MSSTVFSIASATHKNRHAVTTPKHLPVKEYRRTYTKLVIQLFDMALRQDPRPIQNH